MSNYKPPGRYQKSTGFYERPAPFTGAWSFMEINLITLCEFRKAGGLGCNNCEEHKYDNSNTKTDCAKFREYFKNKPCSFYNSRFENIGRKGV